MQATSVTHRERSTVDSLVRVVAPRYWISLLAVGMFLAGIAVWSVFGTIENSVSGEGVLLPGGSVREVHAGADAVLQTYAVQPGDQVTTGQQLAELTLPDGSTQPVTAPIAGQVSALDAAAGQAVRTGATLVTLAQVGAPLVAVGTIAADTANGVVVGAAVRVVPIGLNGEGFETIAGTVTAVSDLPVSTEQLAATVGSEGLARELVSATGGAVKSVTVELAQSTSTDSGYQVSNEHGQTLQLRFGMQVGIQVITASERPIDKVLT